MTGIRPLRPTETADTIFEIDFDRLYSKGRRALLFDLDNTLGRRGMEHLDDRILPFLLSLEERGLRVGILTNRRRNAEGPAMEALRRHFPVIHGARKPARSGFLELLGALHASPREAVMIGDRRWTDILGANRLGMHSIRVRSRAR